MCIFSTFHIAFTVFSLLIGALLTSLIWLIVDAIFFSGVRHFSNEEILHTPVPITATIINPRTSAGTHLEDIDYDCKYILSFCFNDCILEFL